MGVTMSKNPYAQSLHYRRIHARVWRAAWSNLQGKVRNVISQDSLHVSQEYAWFENKVEQDANRIFEDSNYYDNDPLTFKFEQVCQ
jgi:hypothetical protein